MDAPGPAVILRLTLRTAEFRGEAAAEWQTLEKQLRIAFPRAPRAVVVLIWDAGVSRFWPAPDARFGLYGVPLVVVLLGALLIVACVTAIRSRFSVNCFALLLPGLLVFLVWSVLQDLALARLGYPHSPFQLSWSRVDS